MAQANWSQVLQNQANKEDMLLIDSEFSSTIIYGIDNLRKRVMMASPSGKVFIPRKIIKKIIYELREIEKELL